MNNYHFVYTLHHPTSNVSWYQNNYFTYFSQTCRHIRHHYMAFYLHILRNISAPLKMLRISRCQNYYLDKLLQMRWSKLVPSQLLVIKISTKSIKANISTTSRNFDLWYKQKCFQIKLWVFGWD